MPNMKTIGMNQTQDQTQRHHKGRSLRLVAMMGLAMLVSMPMFASEDVVEIDGICYLLDEETKTAMVVENPHGNRGDIVIPETIENDGIPYDVTSIGGWVFWSCGDVTSVTIGNNVKSIGEYAFSSCIALTSVTIGNSVTRIGKSAFSQCRILPSITIPNSVTCIEDEAFRGCWNLSSITIPSSVTSIGSGLLHSCIGLTSINVEAGNTKYDSRDNCNAIIETESNALIAGCPNTIIPPGQTLNNSDIS